MYVRQWQACPFPTKQSIRTLALALALGPAFSANGQQLAFADLSFEELGSIEITSVSKRSERVLDAPASIFVISNEDIRRSGARSLPEALRLAPNLDVARVNSNTYAISARGFNNAIGNKLLVLIDGRTVYTPLFSGVNWDIQNVMLEDVERIEVISGPGATLWGANAMNGVINVITRKAQDSQGTLISGAIGNQGQQGAVRHGGKLDDGGYYRVYGMGFNQDNTVINSTRTSVPPIDPRYPGIVASNGTNAQDSWKVRQAGFRADWGTANHGSTFQGDMYDATIEENAAGEPTRSGANLLARWERTLDDGSRLHIQTYLDQAKRFIPTRWSNEENMFDLEVHHGFQLNEQHRILWGGGTRHARSATESDFLPGPVQVIYGFEPATRNLHWNNLFVQDEISLDPDLILTLGMKAETNVYTGVEYLPSARLAYKPDNNSLLWGALSRAVRAPSRVDRELNLDLQFTGIPPIEIIDGGPDFRSETVKTLEIGYRAQPTSTLSWSMTAFFSDYDHLRSGQSWPPTAVVQNMMEGHSYGIEGWGTWQATPDWRLSGGIKTIEEDFRLKAGSRDPEGFRDAGNDAGVTWMLRSTWNVTSKHEFDVMVRHTSPLPAPSLPAYTAVDMRLGWRPSKQLDLSLIVTDLFDDSHPEFIDHEIGVSNEIGRSASLRATLAF